MIENLINGNLKYKALSLNGLILLLLTYFIFHALYGDRGVIAYFKLNQRIEKSLSELEMARLERLELEHRVNLLRPQSLDTDALDEIARKTLGVSHPKEQVFGVE
ncbi:MAG: Septum formation initiator [Rickettsiaceae bacterium]|jgi:cell division protein FtsB|nr:Septum formation initiator [Rickettsiaceae bacterium]